MRILGFKKIGGQIKLYLGDKDGDDELPLQESYYDIKLLMTQGRNRIANCHEYVSYRKEKNACYVLLKKGNGKGVLMELFEEKIILDDINWKNFKAKIVTEDGKNDLVIRLWDKRKHDYSIYSLLEGFIFGPYRYSTITEYCSCVIMDKNMYVDDYGWTTDLSKYTIDSLDSNWGEIEIYSRKEKDVYYVFLDCLQRMSQEEYNEKIMVYEGDNFIYRYNKVTKEIIIERVERNNLDGEWTYDSLIDAANVAYEGYSRLELGLDD